MLVCMCLCACVCAHVVQSPTRGGSPTDFSIRSTGWCGWSPVGSLLQTLGTYHPLHTHTHVVRTHAPSNSLLMLKHKRARAHTKRLSLFCFAPTRLPTRTPNLSLRGLSSTPPRHHVHPGDQRNRISASVPWAHNADRTVGQVAV